MKLYLPEQAHPATRVGARQVLGLLLVLAALRATADYNYLLFHSLVETARVVVLGGIFVLSWNSRPWVSNSFLLLVGISSFFVGLLELFHALSYKGLGAFPGSDANLPTQLWIAFRYMESLSLLAAILLIQVRLPVRGVVAAYGALTTAIGAGIYTGLFPDCFIEGQGLTPFKIVSEYLIAGLLAVCLGWLFRLRRNFDPGVLRLLSAAIFCGALAEILFTRYVSVYGSANEIGHYLLLVSAYLFYRAVLVTGIVAPFDLLFRSLKEHEAELERKVAERTEELRQSEARARAFAENSPSIIYLVDAEDRYTMVNPAMERLLQRSRGELIGKCVADLLPDDIAAPIADAHRRVFAEKSAVFSTDNLSLDGTAQVFESVRFPLFDGQGRLVGAGGISNDVTEHKAATARIAYLAHHDLLTGLPNRLLFQELFALASERRQRTGHKLALLSIDLDNFKVINDSLGHVVGDQLLKQIAARLSACVNDGDAVCRTGGDEFLVLLGDARGTESITDTVLRMLSKLSEPVRIDEHELISTASAGVAVAPEDGDSFDTLLQRSDTALFQAKEGGRNTYRFFSPDMATMAIERVDMEGALRRAIERKELLLHYQPQIDLGSGALIGAEALVRWQHPEMGLLAPGRFIPLAEDSGLILPIGAWVLQEACRQAVAWQASGMAETVVAVNLSAVQFRGGDLYQTVVDALLVSGLSARCLELELTESILIRDTESALETVRRLKSLGVKLSIDDFGTGYSSLSYLRRFAVDKLKIDQSFVRGMVNNPEDAALVHAIIQMARGLGLRTIAEGVEHADMLDPLRRYHCDEVQGYHISRPLPADQFFSFAQSHLTL